MASEDIHSLIPGICEYVSLNGKRVFADMIKGTDLEMGRVPRITQVSSI